MIQRMFVTLDTKKTNYKNVGKINHGDDLILELTVLSDGNMITFNDPMADLLVKKSDGKMIRQNSGIEHIKPNKFVIEVSKDCVTSPGLSTNQLIINDNGRISTCMFYYTILNSLEEDIIESISSVEVLEQLDEYVIEARERMELLNNDINELEKLFGATSDKLVEAENARNEAEQNRISSEILRVNNENDRIEADNIRNQNEIDRSSSELVREQRESERMLNEEERRQNESERMIDESTRQQNENARESNESIRMSNEIDRKIQENIRVTAETNRVNAETIRRNNENSRISNETKRQKTMNEMKSLIDEAEQNENTRQSNESIRMSNETDRKIQENSRVTAEVNRVNAETNRVNAETNRVNAETTRRNNENSRISNETERQKTMNEMKSLIDEFNGFDERIRVIEDEIDDVCDSKIDFFGKEHDKLNTRLNADFDNVHQRINESELLPYEGCSIKADNSYYGLQKDTVIKGRTLQNLAYNYEYNIYYNGNFANNSTIERGNNFIKVTVNEPTEGNLTHAYNYIVLGEANDILFKDQTTYTFILKIDTNIEHRTSVSLKNGSATSSLSTVGGFVNGRAIITTDFSMGADGVKTHFVYLGVPLMKAGDYINVSDLIILEGDHTQTPLEELPYIEGIESVGDKSKNLLNEEDFKSINNWYYTEITTDLPYKGYRVKLEANKTYTLSKKNNVSGLGHTEPFYMCFSNVCGKASGIWSEWLLHPSITSYNNAIAKTTTDGNGYAYINFYGVQSTLDKAIEFIEGLQLEEGTQATPYQPYYDGYKINGKSYGKNLFNWKTQSPSRIEDFTAFIKLDPNKTYCVSISSEYYHSNGAYCFYTTYDENKKAIVIGKSYWGGGITGAHWLRVRNGKSLDSYETLQIEEGAIATPYEPYQESNYSYISNEPLRSLPNGVCDEIDLKTGVLTRKIGKYTLNGTEAFKPASEVTGNVICLYVSYKFIDIKNADITNNIICDKFPVYKYGTYTDIECIIASTTAIIISFKNVIDSNEAIERLKSDPVTFYFELAEPTTEQLTPQQLKSFDTTTHIISDNKLMPVVSTKIPSNVQAIISTLKLENSDLKNNVEVLSVENEELKETNTVQDEMIDISMMATDEMYSMLEPLLENIPTPMSIEFENGVSKLVYMYVAMVRRGLKTLDEVPTRYREQARAMIQ